MRKISFWDICDKRLARWMMTPRKLLGSWTNLRPSCEKRARCRIVNTEHRRWGYRIYHPDFHIQVACPNLLYCLRWWGWDGLKNLICQSVHVVDVCLVLTRVVTNL